jgi:beta-mannosidase
LSIEDKPPVHSIYLSSDLRADWTGAVRWSLETLTGEVLTSGEETVKAAPLAVTHVRTLDFADRVSDDNRRELVFVVELWQGERRQALQIATFAPTKHVALIDPAIQIEPHVEGDQLIIEVTAHSLARLVELSLSGADVIFSDNYFDLPANRMVSVSCPLPNGWTIEQARSALKVRSVYDSYTS